MRASLGSFGSAGSVYAPEALAEYERCFADPAAIHALCEDYRAAASIDLDNDAADRDRRIECPLLLLWGAQGVVGGLSDPLAVWSEYASDVRGAALEAGHFLVEQRPAETLAALRGFLGAGVPRERDAPGDVGSGGGTGGPAHPADLT